jgi:hypothetical protein
MKLLEPPLDINRTTSPTKRGHQKSVKHVGLSKYFVRL